MKRKAESLALNKLIIIILVILVILAVLMFIFRAEVLEWFRNLPGYTYNETDKEIEASELSDAQVAGMCPENYRGIGFIGGLEGTMGFREKYVHFLIKDNKYLKTKLYWRGTNQEAKIWLLKKDKVFGFDWLEGDLEVAKVEKGLILVNEQFLDLDSEIHQRTRFDKEKSVELRQFLEFVRILHNSYTVGNNKICKIADDPEYKSAWPESVGGEIIDLRPTLENKKGKLRIGELENFIYDYSTNVEFLYLVKKNDYIEVSGYRSGWCGDYCAQDKYDLFRIYPDDSVWYFGDYRGDTIHGGVNVYDKIDIQDRRQVKEPLFMNRDNPYLFRDLAYGRHKQETNLRVNYEAIKKELEK